MERCPRCAWLPDAIIAKTLPSPRATVRKPYQVLSEPESARLLAAAQTRRDRALVSLLLGAGLRAGELVALDVSDVRESDDGEATIYVRLGKGRKDRQVPIRAEVARCIRSYLASTGRTLGADGPLLLSADRARRRGDRRLSTRAVGYLIERLCEEAATKRASRTALDPPSATRPGVHWTPSAEARGEARILTDWNFRYLREDDTIGVVHRLKNGAPAHILSRDDRAKGGRARAAKARERRSSLLNERRGSKRLEEAAERLGQLLRSNNMQTAMWADGVIKQHILPEPSKHLPFPYMQRPCD